MELARETVAVHGYLVGLPRKDLSWQPLVFASIPATYARAQAQGRTRRHPILIASLWTGTFAPICRTPSLAIAPTSVPTTKQCTS
eukprot:9478843-Pyramimonas_sp.AAC.1